MKVTVPTTKEIDIKHIYIEAPVRYGDEDIPYDFPLEPEPTPEVDPDDQYPGS